MEKRKSRTKRYKSFKISKVPATDSTPVEEWILIDDSIVNGISPNSYYISNYGRLYSMITKKLLAAYTNSNMYPEYHLLLSSGVIKHCPAHQLISKAFHPLDDYSGLIPNHINNQKTHSYEWNLEWITPSENVRHALKLTKIGYGDTSTNVKLSSNVVESICNLIEQNCYKDHQILDILGLTEFVSRDAVAHIRRGESWLSVSIKYTFLRRRFNKVFTEEQFNIILGIICSENGYYINNFDILKMAGIDINNMIPDKRQVRYNLVEKMKYDLCFIFVQ